MVSDRFHTFTCVDTAVKSELNVCVCVWGGGGGG